MDNPFFGDLLQILAVSLLVNVAVLRLRLPNTIAYLTAGALVSPHLLGWVEQPKQFSLLAEFGVVFLLFSLGLEFSLPRLAALRGSVFGLGSLQVGLCTGIFGFVVWQWGTSIEAAIIIAGALALSSTAIVTKELKEAGQIHSEHGQLSIGILLFQDLAAIIFLILVPVLGGSAGGDLWNTLGSTMAKSLLLVALLLAAGKWVLPLLYQEIARARSEEIFLLTTLVIVLLAAALTHHFHLSMALSGFVIGMMLGESPFRHQIDSDIRGFKDILLGLFFVTVGMNIQLDLLLEFWPRLLLFSTGLIAIKLVLISALILFTGADRRDALRAGLNLAQAGEFGLALLALGLMHRVVPADQASFITLVAIFTMATSPLLVRNSALIVQVLDKFNPRVSNPPPPNLPRKGHVIVGGFGRVGKTLAQVLANNDVEYIAIDQDLDTVSQARNDGYNVIYGDCTHFELLNACHINQADLAVLTFRSVALAKRSIEQIRANGISIPIIVRSYEHGNFTELISLGADYVVPEMLEASLLISGQVLRALGTDESQVERQLSELRDRELFHSDTKTT